MQKKVRNSILAHYQNELVKKEKVKTHLSTFEAVTSLSHDSFSIIIIDVKFI